MNFWPKLLSLPSWERGLKPLSVLNTSDATAVAPFVGAWIETSYPYTYYGVDNVAPFVGAWIETDILIIKINFM